MPGPRNDFSDVRFALSYDALKMSGTPQRDAIFTSDFRNHRRVLGAFDDARPGNQREGSAAAEGDRCRPARVSCRASDDAGLCRPCRARSRLVLWLASMKLANSGCGRSGFDLNSGWNCTATYQGCPGSSIISTNFPSGDLPEMRRPLSVSVGSYRQLNSYR